MGVPSYFGWIVKLVKKAGLFDILRPRLPPNNKIKRLYFDFNCLIHRACREVYSEKDNPESQKTQEVIEVAMIRNVIKVMQEVITEVNPQELIYLAIDGSVPMGKCKQQRYRRFKSVQESRDQQIIKGGVLTACPIGSEQSSFPQSIELTRQTLPLDESSSFSILSAQSGCDFEETKGVKRIDLMTSSCKDTIPRGQTVEQLSPSSFDFNAISPGTEFMNNLAQAIREQFEAWQLLFPDITLIVDDSLNPGEGEHKIVNHIKHLGLDSNDPIVIYGLDADLIFLSLSLHHKPTYLIRENTFSEYISNECPDYLIVDIGSLAHNVIELVAGTDPVCPLEQSELALETKLSNFIPERIIDDYIVVNFFLGNDFVSRIFSFHIKNKGCEIVLENYRRTLREMNSDTTIPFQYLVSKPDTDSGIQINIKFLEHFLKRLVKHEVQWFKTPDKYYVRYEKDLGPIEKALNEYSIVPIYLHYLPPNTGSQGNEDRYYQLLFDESDKTTIVYEYLKSFLWTANYYLGCCKDFQYYYPYHYAPLLSDLVHHLDKLEQIRFQKSEPIDPYHQLMIILPESSYGLLPPIFRRFLELEQFKPYFPERFDLYYYGHRFTWECPPKMPILDSKSTEKYYEYLCRHYDPVS